MHPRRLSSPWSWLTVITLLAAACSVVNRPSDPVADDGSGVGPGPGTGGAGGAGGATGSTSSGMAGMAGVGGIPPGCGDGVQDAGEDCDTAGQSATCDADCTLAMCGDSTLNTDAGETCDTGTQSATCDADCTSPFCGDGTYNALANEECDDGDTSALDGCDGTCQAEGDCSAPRQLTFVTMGSSQTASISSATGGVSGVPVANCDAGMHGAGSDRIYRFDLTSTRTVNISLNPSFAAIFRVLASPCNPATAITAGMANGCDVAPANTTTTIAYQSLPPGAYYVVVDGQTATNEGTFTLTLTSPNCLGNDPFMNGGCALQTVCSLPMVTTFCGGNCSFNHNQFANWWCQLGGYSGALSFNVLQTGLVTCLYYNGGNITLSNCSQVMGPASYGLNSTCTAVNNLICISP